MQSLQDIRINLLEKWYSMLKVHGEFCSLRSRRHWNRALQCDLSTNFNKNWQVLLDELSHKIFSLPEQNITVDKKKIKSLKLDIDAINLVFINGRFDEKLSNSDYDAFQINFQDINQYSDKLDNIASPNIFLHLIESLTRKITLIRLRDNAIVHKPLYILNINNGHNNVLNTIQHHYNIYLGIKSKATIIEHYVSLNNYNHFSGIRSFLDIGRDSKLDYFKLNFENNSSYHFSFSDIKIDYSANFRNYNLFLGSKMLYQSNNIKFKDECGSALINSLSIPLSKTIHNNHIYIEHNKPNCFSKQLYKSIIRDQSKVIFYGKTVVSKDALKTDSQINNNNLLLDHSAEVYTEPQLEIYTDNVKCSHSATSGFIDNEQIFFLRSRGINEDLAKNMIIYAFAIDCVKDINNDVFRKVIESHI